MFGSRASTFSWNPAMLVVMMFCVFSVVSFADRFIPALAFNKLLPRDQLRECAGVFGQQPWPQHQMLF